MNRNESWNTEPVGGQIDSRRRDKERCMPKKPDLYIPTQDEKTAGLGAALYEMGQFCNCVAYLPQPLDPAVINALVESMLIHFRVLLDFFERANRRKDRSGAEYDDVLSSDFGYPPSPVALPTNYRSGINTEITHLSYARARRLRREDKTWESAALLPLVTRSIDFIETRSEEEIHELERFRTRNRMVPQETADLKRALSAIRDLMENEQQRRSAAAGS
jgi:hypothetical protein